LNDADVQVLIAVQNGMGFKFVLSLNAFTTYGASRAAFKDL